MSEQTSIDRVRIDGFGRFSEVELELRPGLNLLHGPNEAGKSTFLAFIRAALFGFERKQAARYEPRSGGAYGGVVRLTAAAGPLLVRLQGKRRRAEGERTVTDGTGGAVGEGALSQALGGVSRQLFSQVFAITLDELQSFEALAEESQVSEALFAATAQGAQRSPHVLQRLRQAAGELYAHQGQRPGLNVALRQLEEVRGRLQAATQSPEAYFAARAELEALGRREAELRAELPERRRRVARLEQLARARPSALELRALPAPLAEDDGSPEALPRLESLEERRLQALRGLAPVEEPLQRVAAELASLEEALARRGSLGETRAAVAAWGSLAAVAGGLEARALGLEERKRQLETSIERLAGQPLGPRWLEGLDAGAARLAGLQAFRDRESDLAAQRAREETAWREAEAEEARLGLVRAEVQSRLPVELPAPQALEAAAAALEQLVAAAARQEQCLVWLKDLGQREAQQLGEAPPGAPWLGAGATVAGLACLALAAASGLVLGGAPVAVPVTLVAAALGVVLVGAFRRLRVAGRERAEAFAARERSRASTRESQAAERASLERELAEIAAAQPRRARLAGVEGPAEAPARRLALARERALAEDGARLRREVAHLELELAAVRDRRARAARRLAGTAAGLDDLQQRLDAELAASGFQAGLRAQQALDLLGEAARLQEAWAGWSREAAQHAEDAAAVARARAALEAQSARAGLPPAGAPQLTGALEALLEQDQRDRGALLAARARREELLEGQARLGAERDEAAARLHELLAPFGAPDGEALRRRAKAISEGRVLRARRRELTLEVEAAAQSGAGVIAAELEAEGDLAAARSEASARLAAAEEALDLLGAEAGALRERLAGLETESLAAALRAEEAGLVARVGALAAEHARLALAAAALQGARRTFEAAHQPRIVGRVSALFEQLTRGRYPRVVLDPATRAACAVDDTGTSWQVTELSRGTRELLLLAFRIAVAEDLGESRVRLPLVLDDVLVDLDPGRAATAVEVLAQVAARHQVLVLTCHPHLRRLFEGSAAAILPFHAGKQLSLLDGRGV